MSLPAGLTADLVARLEAQNVGVYGVDIFASSRAVLPAGEGPFLTVIETGGTSPEHTHNSVLAPAYQRPSAEIIVRGATFETAMTMSRAAYSALFVRNYTASSGTHYRSISPAGEPGDIGPDRSGRITIAFNVDAIKRPS